MITQSSYQAVRFLGSKPINLPQRIISLVPSLTELLVDLGLGNRLVGRTKFCIHPPHLRNVIHVGGTKNFNFDRIEHLQPDLIICNKEENYEAGVELLANKYPVLLSDIYTLEDALEAILQIGEVTGTEVRAYEIVKQIRSGFDTILVDCQTQRPSCAYVIWKEPLMVAGSNTFINEMLRLAGFDNAFAHLQRYPTITIDQLNETRPDYVLLSSEPWPFQESDLASYAPLKAILVDGEMFSWYGSRLKLAPDYFKQLLVRLRS